MNYAFNDSYHVSRMPSGVMRILFKLRDHLYKRDVARDATKENYVRLNSLKTLTLVELERCSWSKRIEK